MCQGERRRLLDLPGADFFILEAPLEGGDELLAARITVSIDRDLHAHTIANPTGGSDRPVGVRDPASGEAGELGLAQVFEEAPHRRPDRLRFGRLLDAGGWGGLPADGP